MCVCICVCFCEGGASGPLPHPLPSTNQRGLGGWWAKQSGGRPEGQSWSVWWAWPSPTPSPCCCLPLWSDEGLPPHLQAVWPASPLGTWPQSRQAGLVPGVGSVPGELPLGTSWLLVWGSSPVPLPHAPVGVSACSQAWGPGTGQLQPPFPLCGARVAESAGWERTGLWRRWEAGRRPWVSPGSSLLSLF